jgi:hypothetical protein
MSVFLHPLLADLSTITAFVGNGIVLAALVGMVAFAWRQGLFVATVVALGSLAAFVGALASTATVSGYLADVEVPASLVPAAAYAITLCGLLLAVRAACGRWLPEQAVWMGGLVSRLAACCFGGIAGAVLAAAALIGWTMLPLPASLTLRPDELFWDPAPWALKVFARCVEFDRTRREAMLGTIAADGKKLSPACSEPFYDENANCVRDSDERYLDRDGDRQFTVVQGGASTPASQTAWRPGLVDHYRLAAWRQVLAMHAPRISSEDAVSVDFASIADGVYRATAIELDACDTTAFSLEVDAFGDDERPLTIDPQTGVVKLTESEVTTPKPKYVFTLTVTDKAQFSDTKSVTVTIKGLPDSATKP